MNKVIIRGTLLEKPKLSRNYKGNWYTIFYIEVKLPFKAGDKEPHFGEFRVRACGRLAHFIHDNFDKDKYIGLIGHLENIYHDIKGQTIVASEIVVDEVEI